MAGCKKRFSLGIVISLLFLSMFGSFGWVKGDEVTETLDYINHKIYAYEADGTESCGTSGSLFGYDDTIGKFQFSDNTDYASSDDGDTADKAQYVRWDWNMSYIMRTNGFELSEIQNIYFVVEGWGRRTIFGPAYEGGMYSSIYNSDSGTWQSSNSSCINGLWSHTGGSDANLTLNLTGDFGDYLVSDDLIKFCVHTPDPTSGYVSYLQVDYVRMVITYSTLTPPALVSPTSGGTGYGTVIDFDWNVSTGGTSPYTYEIMVADNLSFTTPDVNATGLSDSNYSYTTGLTPGTTYYWKVRTKDNGGAYSSWATTQSFTTASFTAPTISAPVNGVETSDTTPTITYSASTGGSGTYTYEVQIDDSSEFGSPAVDITGQTSTSYTPTTELSLIRYYARVRAKDSLNNYSAWSSPISFTVIASSSGGSGSASTMESTSTDPTINQSTIVEDTPAVTTSSGSTNIITKYIITPVQTIVINPMKNFFVWVWESLTGLIRGSNQEEIYLPVVGEITMSGLLILIGLGIAVWILLFGSPIKKKDVKKIGRTANKNVRKIRGMI